MRPSFFASSSNATASASVVTNGLSTTTSRPASKHFFAREKCVWFGVAITTSRIDPMASNSSTLRTIRASGNTFAAESAVRCTIAARRNPGTARITGAWKYLPASPNPISPTSIIRTALNKCWFFSSLVSRQKCQRFLPPIAKRQQCITDTRSGSSEWLIAQVGSRCADGISLFFVERTPSEQQGPARGLYLGLVFTILAVLAYAAYITIQFAGVRKLQSQLVDRNRRGS